MACENAINATDVLAGHIREHCSGEEWAAIAAKAVFANTAVDRIVPAQAAGAGLDVTVETYFEWAIESAPFGGRDADDPGRDLGGRSGAVHRAEAVHGQHRSRDDGVSRAGPGDRQARRTRWPTSRSGPRCEGVLAETKRLLVAKHEFSAGGAAGVRGQDPDPVRRTRTCRTPPSGSGGSRCASCPGTSG